MKTVCLILGLVCALHASDAPSCRAPAYHRGQDFVNPEGRGSIYVSVQPSDVAVNSLICLAATLRAANRQWQDIGVLIFSSADAADHFQASTAEYQDPTAWNSRAKQLRAAYFLDAGKHEEYLEMMPLGYKGPASYNTRIDLPPANPPQCRVSIKGRCLTSFELPAYPLEALRSRAHGEIRLHGIITRKGRVTDLRLEEAESEPADPTVVLASAARHNLATWQLEYRKHKDEFSILYSYELMGADTSAVVPKVQLDLPSRILIVGKP